MSQKSERLVNLTIALLATRRHLTKSEIFTKVEGYDGEPEARDRMFERDKEDLRTIGITIDVASIDSYFDDEIGYRISPNSYKLQLDSLSSQERILLSLAFEKVASSQTDEILRTALIKLGVDSIPNQVGLFTLNFDLELLTDAIVKSNSIAFDYESIDGEVGRRTIEPWHLQKFGSHWYLLGYDIEKAEKRTFRLDRITSDFEVAKNKNASGLSRAEIDDFLIQTSELEHATVEVIDDNGLPSHFIGSHVADSRYDISYSYPSQLIDDVLTYSGSIVLRSPLSARDELLARLNRVKAIHE